MCSINARKSYQTLTREDFPEPQFVRVTLGPVEVRASCRPLTHDIFRLSDRSATLTDAAEEAERKAQYLRRALTGDDEVCLSYLALNLLHALFCLLFGKLNVCATLP